MNCLLKKYLTFKDLLSTKLRRKRVFFNLKAVPLGGAVSNYTMKTDGISRSHFKVSRGSWRTAVFRGELEGIGIRGPRFSTGTNRLCYTSSQSLTQFI